LPKVYSIDGITPIVDPSAFVHPSAVRHGAVLHGCVVRRGALIGMTCVVNDNAEVGEDAIVAALASEAEPNRRRIELPGAVPLSELKAKHG
jgi:phenylacetic acid degradation protein